MKQLKQIPNFLTKPSSYKYRIWFLLGIVLLLVTIIRIRLLNVPLERDEGEYAYMGQLILQGIPPYAIAFNMKFPGTYYMYAFFMSIFGQSVVGVHFGLLIVNLTSILLLFLLVRKLINGYAALVAATTFAILSLSYSVLGFAGHATHFVLLFAIAGTFLLFKATTENKKIFYFLSGMFLGFAPVMKQPGIFFCLFGGLFLIIRLFIHRKSDFKLNLKRFVLFFSGGMVPMALLILTILLSGVFNKFWFWTIHYAMAYENQINLKDAFTMFKVTLGSLLEGFHLIWIFATLGLVALFLHPKLKKDFRALFILLFFIFSYLSICPGFYFRNHYFVTLLPAVAILDCVLIDYVLELSKQSLNLKILKYLSYSLFVIPIIIGFLYQFEYFFIADMNKISRIVYGSNPFPESIEIAKYIELHSSKQDKIAILGSEPQICFYANRHSASGYLYTYSLMENHKNSLEMQKEMINEIEFAMPKYLVYIHISTSWLVRSNSEKYIFSWVNSFIDVNKYEVKGITDIFSDQTIYKWDKEVNNYTPHSENCVITFEKK